MSGKGSAPRPYSVPKKVYDDNWEKIFGKKSNQDKKQPTKEKTK
jgi:hypothetical protein